jgi:hypothetical protein
MDTANPYQVHDSIVNLVILGLVRWSGRLPNSGATDHVRKLDNSNVGTLELRSVSTLIFMEPYRRAIFRQQFAPTTPNVVANWAVPATARAKYTG